MASLDHMMLRDFHLSRQCRCSYIIQHTCILNFHLVVSFLPQLGIAWCSNLHIPMLSMCRTSYVAQASPALSVIVFVVVVVFCSRHPMITFPSQRPIANLSSTNVVPNMRSSMSKILCRHSHSIDRAEVIPILGRCKSLETTR